MRLRLYMDPSGGWCKALTALVTKLVDVDSLRPRTLGITEYRYCSVRCFRDTENNAWKRIEPSDDNHHVP